VSEYVLQGQRVVHNNIALYLHRVLPIPPVPKDKPIDPSQSSVNSTAPTPRESLPPLDSLSPLDPIGSYVLQATVRVLDGSKPESMALGIDELKGLRDSLHGVVELEVGDRLALDTRVK
jgi:mediator of RNA polymerase II transcription subunit 18